MSKWKPGFIAHGAKCDKIDGAFYNTYVVFQFALKEELIAGKVILFAMHKIDCEGNLLVCILKKITKIESTDNVAKKCQMYKMNKINCYSVMLS